MTSKGKLAVSFVQFLETADVDSILKFFIYIHSDYKM